MLRKWCCLVCCLAAGICPAALAGEPAPHGLLCELLRWPERTTITRAQPAFGWIVPGDRGEPQTGFQIQVAADAAGFDGPTDRLAWDSGRVTADTSINVRYGGAALQPGRAYWWRVRVWRGTARNPTPFSSPQGFRMGPLNAEVATPTLPLVETPVAPATMTTAADGTVLVDFGRTAFGYLMLDESAGRQSALTVRHGESLLRGTIDLAAGVSIRAGTVSLPPGPGGWRRMPFAEPVRPAAAVPLPERVGTILPFRYVELVSPGVPWEAGRIRQHTVHYPFDETESSFRSSDLRLNAIWQLAKYTMKATSFAGVYVDGDRERIPYEADAYINQLGHYYVDREFALARHSHEYLLDHPTWPTEWGFHSVFMAWADYLHTGDASSLARNYEKLRARLLLERLDSATGLFASFPERVAGSLTLDLVDWPEGERDGHVFTEHNTVLNAFLYRSLVLMERLARVLDHGDDATRFGGLAAQMKRGFRAHFLDEVTGVFRDGVGVTHGSLHANLFPLAFGLVEMRDRPAVVAYLKQRGMRCSVYAAQYLLEALFEAGEAEAALSLIVDPGTDRSWTHMVKAGATIAWEAWDMKYKPNLDWNHAWGAAPANLLPRYVLGVQPLEPGFARIRIAPQLGALASVAGRVPTIRGGVEVAVTRTARTVTINLKRPANMRVSFAYPLGDRKAGRITVNGRKVDYIEDAGWLQLADVPGGEARIVISLK